MTIHVPKDMYSLNGGLPSEAYCINKIEGYWEVYYSERGQKSSLKVFQTESEACEYFLNILSKYANK